MLTKTEKKEYVTLGKDLAQKSKTLIFADFSGANVGDIRKLKTELKKAGAKFQVIKKRLLKLALKDAGVDFDPTQFDAQVGTIFADNEMTSVAGTVYKFSKELEKAKKNFKILGAYDLIEKSPLDAAQFTVIAKLPSREILLAQIMGMVSGPVRAFMYMINELSKKSPATAEAVVAPQSVVAEAKPADEAQTVEPK